MPYSFDVHGPFLVPLDKIPAKKKKMQYFQVACNEKLDVFWEQNEMANEKGCYVFVNSVAGGVTPIYVGKTNVSFRNEIFTPHKRVLLNQFINTTSKKGLRVFFITPQSNADMKKIIDEIESYLIIQAKRANEELLNEKKTAPKWSIAGIYGETKIGKPSKAVSALKKSLKL